MTFLSNRLQKYKDRLRENSCSTLIWLINLLPTSALFPLLTDKTGVWYWMSWIIILALLNYINVVGTIVYQMYVAKGYSDIIISTFSLLVSIIVISDCIWFIFNRKYLNDLIRLAQRNDAMIRESGRNLDGQQKKIWKIKFVIIMYYLWQLINVCIAFIPARFIFMDEFAIVNCVGIEPLTCFPKRQICMVIIATQTYTSLLVVTAFDAILMFLFSHTTVIFEVLYEDLTNFTDVARDFDGSVQMNTMIVDRLKNVIIRHSHALQTVEKLQNIYSTAIGVTFGVEAVSLCLFFVLSFEDGRNYLTLIFHSILLYFIYCYLGERLTAASERFETAVYSCGWEYLGVKEQKSVLLILIQAQKPVIILAAKVVPIRVYTFATTMQYIYKFVTVFKV